jgi:hypothetical protein
VTDSTATVWIAIVAGVPATLAAIGNLFVILRTRRIESNVAKIETQTNSMNSQMVASAEIKGEKVGKEKAEAAQMAGSTITTPALPLLLRPDLNQEEVVKWVMQGVAIEKARRLAEGNGPKT